MRRLRRDARIALYSALLAATAGTWALARIVTPPDPRQIREVERLQAEFDGIDFTTYPEVRLLREYVAIDSSHPEPDEQAAAELLARELSAAGLAPTIERFPDRRANVWAFVEGEDPRAIVLAGHLDVEAAREQEGWIYPPFSGTVHGPWIYGRGMYDMKSLTVAQLLAVADLARSGRRPARSVLFLATSSEEIGSDLGTRWILREHPELVERMGLVLGEGGVVEALSYDQIKYWGIEFAQKRFGTVTFCSGSRENLEGLRQLLLATGKSEPRPAVAPPVERFLRDYAGSRGLGSYQAVLSRPERIVADRAEYEKLTNFMQALFRDELFPWDVEPAAGGGFELRVTFQLLPGSSFDEVVAELLPDWKRFGIASAAFAPPTGDSASETGSRDYSILVDAVRDEFPGADTGAYFLPWAATDARFFRAAGVPAYGFSPFPMTVTETLQIGRPNERMQLPAFVRGVSFYRKLIARLARQPWSAP